MLKSCVLIIPAEMTDEANMLAEAMDWGPGCYSVPLAPEGAAEPTHYGLHAWVMPSFVEMIGAGVMPQGLDYPAADFAAVMAALVVSVRDDGEGHFAEVCAAEGLAMPVAQDRS